MPANRNLIRKYRRVQNDWSRKRKRSGAGLPSRWKEAEELVLRLAAFGWKYSNAIHLSFCHLFEIPYGLLRYISDPSTLLYCEAFLCRLLHMQSVFLFFHGFSMFLFLFAYCFAVSHIVINADDCYGKEGFKAVHDYLVDGGKPCMADLFSDL